jgi:hypothetical protein
MVNTGDLKKKNTDPAYMRLYGIPIWRPCCYYYIIGRCGLSEILWCGHYRRNRKCSATKLAMRECKCLKFVLIPTT